MVSKRIRVEKVEVIEEIDTIPDNIGLFGEYSCVWKINLDRNGGIPGRFQNFTSFADAQKLEIKIPTPSGFDISWVIRLGKENRFDGCLPCVPIFAEIEKKSLESLSNFPIAPKFYVSIQYQRLVKDSHSLHTFGKKHLEEICFGTSASYVNRCLIMLLLRSDGIFYQVPQQDDGSFIIIPHIRMYAEKSYIELAQAKARLRKNNPQNYASLHEHPEETGADITIVSKDGMEFRAHKPILLCAPIKPFRKMLTSGMMESKTRVIKLDDISSKAVKFLLHYIYLGDLRPFKVGDDDKKKMNEVDQEEEGKPCLSELIYAAHKYMIKDLLDYFDDSIGHICNVDNATFLLSLANKFSLKKAQNILMTWIKNNEVVLHDILKQI